MESTKKIAIMQPYFFPYIGYFHLINAVDVFVFYDDVSFIKKGWIHRNRILNNGTSSLFIIPCKEASQNKLINEIKIDWENKGTAKFLKTIEMAYKKAPFFNPVFSFINQVFSPDNKSISDLNIGSIKVTAEYLNITGKKFYKSSERYSTSKHLKKADRLIEICKVENIVNYINPAGGMEIYSKEYFNQCGISLSFIESNNIEYAQFSNPFVKWLSIIDVMMFNSTEKIKNELLPAFQLT